jgi:hypothetical protein
MTHAIMNRKSMSGLSIMGLIVLLFVSMADAKSSSPSSGKSPKGAMCDYRAHPIITTVMPDRVKPGQKITISGKNFGSKQCFHSVSFGPKSTDAWTYLSATAVEATVPSLRPGAVPVTVSTEAGSAQYSLEVQAK